MHFIKLLIPILAAVLIIVLLSFSASKTLYMQTPVDELVLVGRNYFLRDDAIVNIICNTSGTNYRTATGVFIDPRGIILSNAHIAAGLGDNAVCSLRRGSPASKFTEASLIFVPASYMSTNTEAEKALYDISIWKIRGSDHNLPYIEPETKTTTKSGDTVTAISYPGEGLAADNLKLVLSEAVVKDADNYVIQAYSQMSARHGSSGGILANTQTGEFQGLIFGIDQTASLIYALTPRAINITLEKETGLTLSKWLKSQELLEK